MLWSADGKVLRVYDHWDLMWDYLLAWSPFQKHLHFNEPNLGEDCVSLWCFSPVGVWWFYCSNLCYGLSSAFDYVNFTLFYHHSLPFFSHFEMKDRAYNDERYRE